MKAFDYALGGPGLGAGGGAVKAGAGRRSGGGLMGSAGVRHGGGEGG